MHEPIELLHAYRSLLRAATYLPDSFARTQIHNSIVFRFKSTSRKIKTKKQPTDQSLIQEQLAEAGKNARWLERAGNGSVPDLKKVLLVVYGRMGKRRRELISSLTGPEETELPEDNAALEKFIQAPGKQQNRFSPTSKFYSFLRSQANNNPSINVRRPIKELNAPIPKENIWGRPTPLKAQAGLRRRWWASTLSKLLPPIPLHEWNHLKGLATGRIPIEEPPRRRARGSDEKDSNVLQYFRTPEKVDFTGVKDVRFDVGTGLQPVMEEQNVEPKKMKTRSMRRLYAVIWNQTPTMIQDETTKLWETKWGGERSLAQSGAVSQPSMRDMELFEGIEDMEPTEENRLSQQTKKQRKHGV